MHIIYHIISNCLSIENFNKNTIEIDKPIEIKKYNYKKFVKQIFKLKS